MSRRTEIKKRPIPADPVYNSRLVTMTVRRIMHSGKKSTANRIIYGAFEIIKERTGGEPMEVFEKAVKNTTHSWKSRLAASVVRPTRCPWKSRPIAVLPCPCAG